MKKYIILSCIVLFLGTSSMAQVFFGGKVGVNMAMLSENPKVENFNIDPSFGAKFSLELGGVAYFKFNPYFSIQTEFNYARKGFRTELINEKLSVDTVLYGEWNHTYDYLEIPLMFKLSLGSEGFNPFIEFGGYYGYMLYASKSWDYNVNNVTYKDKSKGFDSFPNGRNLNRTDYGFKIGVGGAVRTGKGLMYFSIRYSNGLVDILKDNTGGSTFKNQTFQLSVGYLLEVRNNNTNKIYYY